jgi:hypothetical protein
MSVQLIVLVSLTNSLDLPIAGAAENRDFAGSVEIGSDRKMYLKCTGHYNAVGEKCKLTMAAPAHVRLSPKAGVTLPIALLIISACVS